MWSKLEGNEILREVARRLRERPIGDGKGFVCNILRYDLHDVDDSWTIGIRYALCDELEKFVRAAEPRVPYKGSAWLTWLGITWEFRQEICSVASANAFRAVVSDTFQRRQILRFDKNRCSPRYPPPIASNKSEFRSCT